MHAEAYEGFGWALGRSGLDRRAELTVLDVGGQNVNGCVHDYFTNADTAITTLDLENADIIADAVTWRSDLRFDVAIATEVFEHVRQWPSVIATMRHHLKPGGVLLATCASTGRRPHGATGALDPAEGEWYRNVSKGELEIIFKGQAWPEFQVVYHPKPWGDAYMWARA